MRRPLLANLLPTPLALLAFAAPAPAQTSPRPPAPTAGRVVLTDDQGRPAPAVRLEKVDVHALIRGPVARATVTLTFANTGARVTGGELAFPLPPGATVTGYALNVNGVMVDGVAVEKQQAGFIYTSEAHPPQPTGRDPGLVEHVGGDTFGTRVYPIPPGGSRTVRVQYLTDLSCTPERTTLSLPMGWGDAGRCAVRVEAPDAAAAPTLEAGAVTQAFVRSGRGFVAEAEVRGSPAEVVVAMAGPPGPMTLIEKRPRDAAPALGDKNAPPVIPPGPDDPIRYLEQSEFFFLLNDTPPAPPAGPAPAVAADLRDKPVRRAAILWDAGLSRAGSDKSRELALLASLLQGWGEAAGGAGGKVAADLVVFRDTAEPPVRFDLGAADERAKLIDRLARTVYDGASDLGHLPLPADASGFAGASPAADGPAAGEAGGNYDCLLLFTDGMGGVGPERMRQARAPVYAFSDDARVDPAVLDSVCRRSGGRWLDLRQCDPGLTREPFALVSVDYRPEEVADVSPVGPASVEGAGRVTVTGRLLSPGATVTLNYGYGGRVVERRRFTLRIADAVAGDLAGRYGASRKVAALAIKPDVHDGEIARLGRKFNLVTPNTSLLVLETADQYARYNVVPPRDVPGLYERYMALTAPDTRRGSGDDATANLKSVLYAWEAYVNWWEDYTPFIQPRPAQQPVGGSLFTGSRLTPGEPQDPRTAERRATVRHAADARESREVARDAGRALRSGDGVAARDLYAQALMLDGGNAVAVRELGRVSDDLAGRGQGLTPRERLAEQARLRAARSATDFNAALARSAGDVKQGNTEGADFEIDQAREALGSGLTAWTLEASKAFEARLAEAKRRLNAARLSAARNARAARQKRVEDAHEARAKDERRGGVNMGKPFGGGGSGGGGFGGGTLFGGAGGGAAGGGPSPAAAHVTAPPPVASVGSTAPAAPAVVEPWDPNRPYLNDIKAAPPSRAYDAFLEQRRRFGRSPAFYLDCADYFGRVGLRAQAVRALTDVASFRLADAGLLRRAAYQMRGLGEPERAVELFERVQALRPDDPQSRRDLAMALSDRADARVDRRRERYLAAADYARCLDLLNPVRAGAQWSWGMDALLLMDANGVLARARRLNKAGDLPPPAIPLDPGLVRDLECDLRVVVSCSSGTNDVRLSVTEPDGETIGSGGQYSTMIGGRADGGPACQYCLRTLSPGLYKLQIHVGEPAVGAGVGPCSARVTVFTDFGRAGEKRQSLNVNVPYHDADLEVGLQAHAGAKPVFLKPAGFDSTETAP